MDVLQGIKSLIPLRRLPIDRNTCCLLRRSLIGHSDEELILEAKLSPDPRNVIRSED